MFNKLTLARVKGLILAGAFDRRACAAEFAPCGPTQPASVGFVAPRAAHGMMMENVAGHYIMAAQVETRSVPSAEIKKWVDAAARKIEGETGRKPGKKQRGELKQEALLDLMPKAFPKATRVAIWIDPVTNLIALDNTSAAKTDAVFTLLAQALEIVIEPVTTVTSPAAAMRAWLVRASDGAFDFASECELRNPDTKASVRYANTSLAAPDIRQRVSEGMSVCKLGLDYLGQASFVLSDNLTLSKIELNVPGADGQDDAFDADVAITTGTLRPMLQALLNALGGETAT